MKRERLCYARIIAKESVTLARLSDEFLAYDTYSQDRHEAILSLNNFYQTDIKPHEDLTLYWCLKVGPGNWLMPPGSVDEIVEEALELPFSDRSYPKLQHRVFMTIRRYDRFGDEGDYVEVMVPVEGE